jgi:uncharacterized protein
MDLINNARKIGVISDSHIPSRAVKIPKKVFEIFTGCDAIIHCGDIVSPTVIAERTKIAPFYGVKGNMDPENIDLPSELTLKINDKFLIGVWHGNQSHYGLSERIYNRFIPFMAEMPYMLIHGHSHTAEITEYSGVKIFNPGSPTSGNGFNSVGILIINNTEITPQIITL